jgi:hypothetical protein
MTGARISLTMARLIATLRRRDTPEPKIQKVLRILGCNLRSRLGSSRKFGTVYVTVPV